MVRPALGDEGLYGVEGTGLPEKWAWKVGVAAQYQRAPVLVISEGEIISQPVSDRVGGWAGFSLGLGKRVAVQAVLPIDWQSGNDAALSAPGLGGGDPRVGVRYGALDTALLDTTVRADLYLPVGRQDAWLGEASPRGAIGASAALNGGFGAILLDAGLVIRELDSPEPRFDWGPTGELGVGARVDITPAFSAGAGWVARAVLAGLATGDGELASEALVSARYAFSPVVALSAGGGVGTQAGAGVPTWRAFALVTFDGAAPKPEPKPVPVAQPDPPTPKQILEEEIPGVTDIPPPEPPPAVQVVGEEIVYRDEIRFAVGSADLLPESKPVIASIADLLAADGRIAHLAIEGHASKEGDLVFNWDLSDRRARSVWEALVLEGVNPERMSWRGLGEVAPAASGATEGALSQSRRVVFRIARRLAQNEAAPIPSTTVNLPWNGQSVTLDAVSIPEPKAPPPKEIIDQSFFDEEEGE